MRASRTSSSGRCEQPREFTARFSPHTAHQRLRGRSFKENQFITRIIPCGNRAENQFPTCDKRGCLNSKVSGLVGGRVNKFPVSQRLEALMSHRLRFQSS